MSTKKEEGLKLQKGALSKLNQVMELADRSLAAKSSRNDRRKAVELVKAIHLIEERLFSKKTPVNYIEEPNSWGVEASYHSKDMEYDIYIPHLSNSLKNVFTLYPEKRKVMNEKKKIIFIASHKIRHRLQIENRVNLITPGIVSNNYLLNEIVRKIKSSAEHNKCSCSYIENPEKHRDMEFDCIAMQHFILSRLNGFNGYMEIEDIPRYVWSGVAKDLLLQP